MILSREVHYNSKKKNIYIYCKYIPEISQKRCAMFYGTRLCYILRLWVYPAIPKKTSLVDVKLSQKTSVGKNYLINKFVFLFKIIMRSHLVYFSRRIEHLIFECYIFFSHKVYRFKKIVPNHQRSQPLCNPHIFLIYSEMIQ